MPRDGSLILTDVRGRTLSIVCEPSSISIHDRCKALYGSGWCKSVLKAGTAATSPSAIRFNANVWPTLLSLTALNFPSSADAPVSRACDVASAANGRKMADLQGVGSLVETLKAEVERLKDQLAAADARASDEATKTAQAITAFEALAQRLEAMAEAKRPTWWRAGCASPIEKRGEALAPLITCAGGILFSLSRRGGRGRVRKSLRAGPRGYRFEAHRQPLLPAGPGGSG
jgi:hypothetical protein